MIYSRGRSLGGQELGEHDWSGKRIEKFSKFIFLEMLIFYLAHNGIWWLIYILHFLKTQISIKLGQCQY